MATLYNRPAPATLADLLAQVQNQPDYPVNVPQAPAPPTASGSDSGLLTPQQRSDVLNQLLMPRQDAAASDVTLPGETPDWGKKLAGSFSDALSNIASIYSGQNLRTDNFNQYLNSLERKKAERVRQQERAANLQRDSNDRRLGYILSADDRAQLKADDLAGRKELQANQLAQRRADEAQAKAQFDQQKQFQIDQTAKQQAFEKEMQQARLAHDSAIERIHERQRNGDKVAEKDDKKIEASKTYTATLADNLDALVTSDADIPKIMDRARRFFDSQNMSKDAREAVDAYFKQEVLPGLIDKQNASLAAGSPQQDMGTPSSGIAGQIGGIANTVKGFFSGGK